MSRAERVAQWVWQNGGTAAGVTRALLTPLAAAFGAVVESRNARYDSGRGVEPTAINAVSVGNLTVGGTGKTPFAAWCAQRLRERGAAPAIVLRGYGDDEWREHALLTPGIPVVVGVDRVRAIAEAAGQGATVAVLDDAFQHRRAARVADLVLISADAWTGDVRLLPAGPWREPLSALRRASVAVITVKGEASERQAALRHAVNTAAPHVPVAEVHLQAGLLFEILMGQVLTAPDTPGVSLASLADRDVLAVSAIGNPEPFEQALQRAGARVTARRFTDHHAFSETDVAALAAAVSARGIAVCTRKDAVKLAPLWPRTARPLWYLSQTIEVRLGEDVLLAALSRALPARQSPTGEPRPTAG